MPGHAPSDAVASDTALAVPSGEPRPADGDADATVGDAADATVGCAAEATVGDAAEATVGATGGAGPANADEEPTAGSTPLAADALAADALAADALDADASEFEATLITSAPAVTAAAAASAEPVVTSAAAASPEAAATPVAASSSEPEDPFAFLIPTVTIGGGLKRVSRPAPTFPPDLPDEAPVFPVPGAPNAMVAGVLSLLLPGVGQLYAGQKKKGITLIVVAIATCMGGGLLNLVAAVDAYLVAERQERGEPVAPWKFF
jgi:hypothetical protein